MLQHRPYTHFVPIRLGGDVAPRGLPLLKWGGAFLARRRGARHALGGTRARVKKARWPAHPFPHKGRRIWRVVYHSHERLRVTLAVSMMLPPSVGTLAVAVQVAPDSIVLSTYSISTLFFSGESVAVTSRPFSMLCSRPSSRP